MKRFLIGLCLCVLPYAASAQTRQQPEAIQSTKPVACMPSAQIIPFLGIEMKEEPIFMGQSDQFNGITVIVMLNAKTGDYTIIETDNTMACVISYGKNSKYLPPPVGKAL